MDQEKKKLILYYNTCSQNLIFYPGTSQQEIKDTIYEILDIPETEKLQILDEEGDPVVLSSSLPNEIKLYIQIKKTYAEKLLNSLPPQEIDSVDWTWNKPSNSSHLLKNGDKTVYQPKNETQSWCLGNLLLDKGEYYFTLLFEPLQCCVHVCLYPFGQVLNEVGEEYVDFTRLWTDYKDPHANHPGPIVETGLYVNMDTKECVICDHRMKKVLKKVKVAWDKVVPAVYFKHEVAVTITSNALKKKPDWI
jgi:hypothetical protein